MNRNNETLITGYIDEIKQCKAEIEAQEQAYIERIKAVKVEYSERITHAKDALKVAEKKLESHLKKQKTDVFPGKTDRVTVPGGILLRQIKNAVRKARHITVAFLKENNLSDAVRTEEYVDWEKIETWSDSKLKSIDTDRKPKDLFSYELTEK